QTDSGASSLASWLAARECPWPFSMLAWRRNYALAGRAHAMAKYRLHCFCQSGNSYKAALYLNCAGLEWEPVFVEFFKGATREPKWRESVNEMGEAPVLEIEGGRKLSQSGVILTYLSEMTDKFAASDEGERMEALRWILFDNHKFTSYLATYRFLKAFA